MHLTVSLAFGFEFSEPKTLLGFK